MTEIQTPIGTHWNQREFRAPSLFGLKWLKRNKLNVIPMIEIASAVNVSRDWAGENVGLPGINLSHHNGNNQADEADDECEQDHHFDLGKFEALV